MVLKNVSFVCFFAIIISAPCLSMTVNSYLLATDQGYLNQPDLVWKKLNEVNGDILFMTDNFKEFKVDSHATGTWDEQNAIASTACSTIISLQQQEFEQQPQRQIVQQPPIVGGSRLVTGPLLFRWKSYEECDMK
ncbi:hypothetical protein CRYUN_Cryun13aG0125800 [Craigia yunnanensis]